MRTSLSRSTTAVQGKPRGGYGSDLSRSSERISDLIFRNSNDPGFRVDARRKCGFEYS